MPTDPAALDPAERMSRDELAALQLERLRWSLRHAYENVPSHLTFTNTTVTITTRMAGFNYVEFLLQPRESKHEIADGATLMASVLDLEGELLVRSRRMVFVKGTQPFDAIATVTRVAVRFAPGSMSVNARRRCGAISMYWPAYSIALS